MLLTASEELATPRPDIATSRADELRKQMLGQVGHVSMCLVTLLEVCLDKDAASRTPSPSDSEDSNSMDGAIQLKSNHVTQLPLDPRVQDVAEQSLACLAHIFTWCSPSLCVSSRLINVLFQYATLIIKTQVSNIYRTITCLVLINLSCCRVKNNHATSCQPKQCLLSTR